MANIIPKLNLNRTPSIVDNNSLIFAKNIRADVDGTIHKDYSIKPLHLIREYSKDIGDEAFGYAYFNDKGDVLAHAISDCNNYKTNNKLNDATLDYYNNYIERYTRVHDKNNWRIVGVIPGNTEFYVFINGEYEVKIDNKTYKSSDSFIIRYNEKNGRYNPCNCNWSWSKGDIDGCVINNLIGEKILVIGESNTSSLVPLKCINLSKSTYKDDETIYTQTPNIPYTNLNYLGTFSHVVPNGVYQFFIRYKIRDDFYTDWFPASKEIFIGNQYSEPTTLGTIKYVNTNLDSDKSVVLEVKHLLQNYTKNYTYFQVGYLISHDDAVMARGWKHFPINTNKIYFDFKEQDIEELDVTDFTKPTFQLYNVGNITAFKNKVYISNYSETDFGGSDNSILKSSADNINIELDTTDKDTSTLLYDGRETQHTQNDDLLYVNSLNVSETADKDFVAIGNRNGILDRMLTNDIDHFSNETITNYLKRILSFKSSVVNAVDDISRSINKYGLNLWCKLDRTFQDMKDFTEYDVITSRNNNKQIGDLGYRGGLTFDDPYYKATITVKSTNSSKNLIVLEKFNSDDLSDDEEKQEARVIELVNAIKSRIYNTYIYLNQNGHLADSGFSESGNIVVTITRRYTYYQYEPKHEEIQPVEPKLPDTPTGPNINPDIIKPMETIRVLKEGFQEQKITIQFTGDKNKFNTVDYETLTTCTTLIPHQIYRFYIHFLRANGEITNGYLCSKQGDIKAPHTVDCNQVIYPKFNNINIPNGYIGCFFSIAHVANKVSTIADIKNYTTDSGSYLATEGVCFDINTMLSPIFKNIPIIGTKQDTITDDPVTTVNTIGKYYYSGDSSTVRYFGADGVVVMEDSSIGATYVKNQKGSIAFINDTYQISPEDEDIALTKCTPYFSKEEISNLEANEFLAPYKDYNLGGYICLVYPFDRDVTTELYTDGSTIMYKTDPKAINSSDALVLKEPYNRSYTGVESDNITSKLLTSWGFTSTPVLHVYSNHNLNYLALTDDPKPKYATIYRYKENEQDDSKKLTDKVVFRLFTSLTLSSAYYLPKMYKEYTRKNYYIASSDNITRFDNTIRSSILEGDEAKINIFRFDANDYYNVPPSKGKIVNLVGVGDMIIAHTEDTMFKFTGSNTLSSSEGEIKPTEGEPFDTGISEVFGSDFGFAGIQNKNNSILSENGYIFFDGDCNTIYIYSGQGQITKINDSIEKLFRYDKIDYVTFANDYYNNRFFINVSYDNGVDETLSFCVHPEIKAFVSLHDFSFTKAFNTKANCYFLDNSRHSISTIDKESTGFYHDLISKSQSIYPKLMEDITLTRTNAGGTSVQLETQLAYSIVDVIFNSNYDIVKTLDAISWCSRFVKSEFAIIKDDSLEALKMADIIEDIGSCIGMRIYTDTCMSNEMNFEIKPIIRNANEYGIADVNSYKLPRYNQGKFTLNYFRNIQNTNDRFNYLPKYDSETKRDFISDNNSLIEGKYFVVRFIFNKDFKLETLEFNYKNKL